VGLLSGMLFDRLRFDESRTVILKELDEHRHRLHQRLMAMEREGFVEQQKKVDLVTIHL
jgi:DNA-binding IclR family transcriptional regulator